MRKLAKPAIRFSTITSAKSISSGTLSTSSRMSSVNQKRSGLFVACRKSLFDRHECPARGERFVCHATSPPIEFFNYAVHLVAEELMHFAETTSSNQKKFYSS